MDPPESQVAMAVGESRNFTCRMTCADGRAASVVWRGLDTSLGAVQSSAGLSILYVLNASLSAAGTRVCVGSCGDVNLQHRVRLLLFGEPPPLPPPLRPRGPGRQPCVPSVPWPPPPGTLPGLPTTSQLLARLAGPPESLCSPRSPRIPLPHPRPILQDLTPCPFRSGLALTPYTLATQAVVAGLACPGAPAVSRNPRPHLHATSSRRSPKPPGSAHPLLPSPTAFPDQLTVSPEAVVPGRDQEVACTAHNVTPPGPDTLSMSLLLGDRELEGVEALPNVTEEPQEGEDSLFQVTQRWLLPTSETSSLRTLHCQVTMRLPGRELTRHRTIPGEPAPVGKWTRSHRPAPESLVSPGWLPGHSLGVLAPPCTRWVSTWTGLAPPAGGKVTFHPSPGLQWQPGGYFSLVHSFNRFAAHLP